MRKYLVLICLVGCDGDDGSTSTLELPATPVTCALADGADIAGEVMTDDGPVTFETTTATFQVGSDMPPLLSLRAGNRALTIWLPSNAPSFAPVDPGEYTVQNVDLYVDETTKPRATATQLVVDATVWPDDRAMHCFAGRFLMTFGDDGVFAGSFRARDPQL